MALDGPQSVLRRPLALLPRDAAVLAKPRRQIQGSLPQAPAADLWNSSLDVCTSLS